MRSRGGWASGPGSGRDARPAVAGEPSEAPRCAATPSRSFKQEPRIAPQLFRWNLATWVELPRSGSGGPMPPMATA